MAIPRCEFCGKKGIGPGEELCGVGTLLGQAGGYSSCGSLEYIGKVWRWVEAPAVLVKTLFCDNCIAELIRSKKIMENLFDPCLLFDDVPYSSINDEEESYLP